MAPYLALCGQDGQEVKAPDYYRKDLSSCGSFRISPPRYPDCEDYTIGNLQPIDWVAPGPIKFFGKVWVVAAGSCVFMEIDSTEMIYRCRFTDSGDRVIRYGEALRIAQGQLIFSNKFFSFAKDW